jgi:uncharacterized protein (DUF2164 family)
MRFSRLSDVASLLAVAVQTNRIDGTTIAIDDRRGADRAGTVAANGRQRRREEPMQDDRLPKEARASIALEIKAYLGDEFDLDIGRFEAEGLLDAILRLAGPHLYNAGLRDAQALLMRHIDDVNDGIDQLERRPEA